MLRQSEKLATLGKLSAGMAHELNNPVAAAQRGAGQLRTAVAQLQHAYLSPDELNLSGAQLKSLLALGQLAQERVAQPVVLDSLACSDREYEVERWLEERGVEHAWEFSSALVSLGYDPDGLAELSRRFAAHQLPVVIAWLSGTYTIYSLLHEIGDATGRIAEIVNALKAYTYLDQAPIQSVDVQASLDNTLVILRSKLKAGISVRRDYADDLPRIQAYGSEMNQVWTNIIDNAIDAMEGQGELILRTRQDGQWVIVQIEDTGSGLPEAIQSKIFDPFFTTKPPGAGAGLGLTVSHSIVVQKHRGKIVVCSEPGQTCFEVRLPINLEPSSAPVK
ncbi:MAG TPA: histidine kinase [Chloroflexi bacterium]|nr:histidine kinase [Chloroflexota bacterium]